MPYQSFPYNLSVTRPFVWRAFVLLLILLGQFAVLEAGLRLYGAFEGTTTFAKLFMDDPQVGLRLQPNARLRYTTVEFTTDIAINPQGIRDDEPLGPKPANERRVVVLGDSLVLSVQVSQSETFCEQLERQLNAAGGADRWRVINAGVQGYGPVDEWMYFDKVAAQFEPDVVLIVPFAGNDAIEAAASAQALEAGKPMRVADPGIQWFRRLVRASVVLQSVRVRWEQLNSRLNVGAPEPALASYLVKPPDVVQQGLTIMRTAYERIARRASGIGARTAIAVMPARFQTDDADFSRLAKIVHDAGGTLDRNAASSRFLDALAPLGLPIIDLQPALAAQPRREGLFFQRTVHLTPRGHAVVAGELATFLGAAGLVRH